MYLILASVGSINQKHGWGFVGTKNQDVSKCEFPAYCTTNLGELLRKASGPLMGHIRQASVGVPVIEEYAHPFYNGETFFMHNGTLTPKKPEDFILEMEVEYTSEEKPGVISIVKEKISDSLIFYEEFVRISSKNPDKTTVENIIATLDKFYGKFAMLLHVKAEKKTYVIRGKTADLHISYIKNSQKEDAKTTGYVINTNSEDLFLSLNLLSNLGQLSGKSPIYFTEPKIIESEKIYLVKDFDLEIVGEAKENSAPVAATNFFGRAGARGGGQVWGEDWELYSADTGNTSNVKNPVVKAVNEIFPFMLSHLLTFSDMERLFYFLYGTSMLEATEEVVEHFSTRALKALKERTTKIIRRRLKSVCVGDYIPEPIKQNYEIPWVLCSAVDQIKLVAEVEAYWKEAEKK
jgi:predicted glutamine amidotransferase